MMKKLLSLTAAMLSFVSVSADPISREKALLIAQEYMVPGHQMTMATQARRSGATIAEAEYAPYYIVSRGDNQGFVIVAGDDCLPEVLGIADQGDFDPDNMPIALMEMLEGWQEMVERAQADGSNVILASQRRAQRRAGGNRVDIAPFVTAHWHQSSPYNDNCPTLTKNGNRALTGCVATAASQILYYWRKDLPSTLQASTPTYGYGDAPVTRSVPKDTPLKWDLMLDQYGSESADYKEPVAEFVFATGAATWLTYGESTSGNIEKIPYTFSTYFGMNGGTVYYRDSYSQTGWTQLLYDELAKGHPVMYTGVHPDQGGHAVFIHGYRASDDKFYFNFGWGGQADGYYTTATTDGMNGFSGSQSALIGAYPKNWNRTATILPPVHVYANTENDFTVTLTNNSTLDFSGVYLFLSTSKTKPSDLKKAKSQDTEIVFKTGATTEITLHGKPTTVREWYVTLTDADLNVLAQIPVTVEKADVALSLKGISLESNADTETYEGKVYHLVYNTQTVADVNVANNADVAYEGRLSMNLQVFDETTQEWNSTGVTYGGDLVVDAHEEAVAPITIFSSNSSKLEVGKHYRLQLANTVQVTKDPIEFESGQDGIIYFMLKEKDMEVVSFVDKCLTLQGHFDAVAFKSSSYSGRSIYKTALVYDLTQCTGVSVVSQDVNPNALIYVADDSHATGQNVICQGKCANLVLTPGYDFTPRADFVAEQAQLMLNMEPAQWYLLTMPFATTVPDGIIVRDITTHLSGSVRTEDVKNVEAGKTYLVMTSSSDNVTLTGQNVTVVSAPVQNNDPAVVGTYVSTTTPASSHLLNHEERQNFVKVNEGTAVEALRGYWHADDTPSNVRAYPSTTEDPPYVTLAISIEEAHKMLKKYQSVATAAAYETYAQEIAFAEKEFSNRGEGAMLTSISAVKEYAEKLQTDGVVYMKQVGNLGNMEIDYTSSIVNPSFELSKTSPRGWTVEKKDGYTSVGTVNVGTAANNKRAVGLDGTYYYQSLIAADDSSSVRISQKVEGLVPGYYRLTAMLGTDQKSTVTMFADNSTVTVSGHPFGPLYLTQAVIDNVKVKADEGAMTGSLLIGVEEGRWYKVDHFTLTYVGQLDPSEMPTTAITPMAVESAQKSKGVYTLQGIRVEKPTQAGIYIMDGKKYFK